MELREMEWDSMDWIYLTEDMEEWRALVNVLMDLRIL
jgi:hypothetical protein